MLFSTPIDLTFIRNTNLFSEFSLHFGSYLYWLSQPKPIELLLSAIACCDSVSQGNVCIEIDSNLTETKIGSLCALSPYPVADFKQWPSILKTCTVVGDPQCYKPLILEGNRLYLQRQYSYETLIATALMEKSKQVCMVDDPQEMVRALDTFFPQLEADINWQRVAGFCAAKRQLCIISGGPGSGKSTTIIHTIFLLVHLLKSPVTTICCVAPTGKASMRLQEQFNQKKSTVGLPLFETSSKKVIITFSTLHKLLGATDDGRTFTYTRINRLPHHVVICDESSMVDIRLFATLLSALGKDSKLILVGDHNQLCSVQAGSVLSDLCESPQINSYTPAWAETLRLHAALQHTIPCTRTTYHHAINDCIVELKKTFRFSGSLQKIADALKQGNETRFFELLSEKDPAIQWIQPKTGYPLQSLVEKLMLVEWNDFFAAEEPQKILKSFGNFRILCVLRSGPFGCETLNMVIERMLFKGKQHATPPLWYMRKPILITANDSSTHLTNGDTCIIAPVQQGSETLTAWSDALVDSNILDKKQSQEIRQISVGRLPSWETGYAMTIHKSQGSEFNSLLVVLPDTETPLLTKQLLYTAITRCKKSLFLYGTTKSLKAAFAKPNIRTSGLSQRLWESDTSSVH